MAESMPVDVYPAELSSDDLRELAARLVCMGAVSPAYMDEISYEKAEEMVAGLPTLYRAYTIVRERGIGLTGVWQFDVTQSGAEERLVRKINRLTLEEMPQKIFSGIEYSPEAWFHFLHHDFSSVNQEILRDSLYRWDIDYDRERVFLGFSEDTDSVIAQAEQLFNEMREDLLARLTRMGIISPLEYINYTPESAREIIGRLPALVEVYMTRGDGVRETERIRFINIAEYTFRKHRLNDDQYEKKPIEDDPRNNRFDSELYPSYTDEMEEEDELLDVTELLPGPLQRAVTRVTDNNKSLQMQISKFFSKNPTEENQFEKHGLTIKGGYAWIDFLNQDFSSAVPMNSQGEPLFDRLKKAFSNWELDPVRYSVNWRAGFETDFARNREEARMMFYRSLFFKLTEAKIIPRFEKEEWFAMNSRTAELYARKVPLLAEQSHVSDWLKLFEQPLPDDPNFMFRLQSSFQAVGISFDREAVKTVFQKPKPQKGKNTMSITQQNREDYLRSSIRRMINNKQMMPIDESILNKMSLNVLRSVLSEDKSNLITADQKFMLDMKNRAGHLNGIELPPGGISALTKQEASLIIDATPKLTPAQMVPERPATEETRNRYRFLTRNSQENRLSKFTWDHISEEALQKAIQEIEVRREITDTQFNSLCQALTDKTLPLETAAQFISSPTIGPEQFKKLNYFQARSILEQCPATPKQIEFLQNMSDNHPLKPQDPGKFTSKEASDLISRITMRGQTIADNAPLTDNDIAALKDALAQDASRQLPKDITAMTHGEARAYIAGLEPTESQIRMIGYLTRINQIDFIPKFVQTGMNRGQASQLIDLLNIRDRNKKVNIAEVQKLVNQIDPPATAEQLEIIRNYQEQGRDITMPEKMTYRQAESLITQESSKQPLTPEQLEILNGWVKDGTLKAKDLAKPEKMTQADYVALRQKHLMNLQNLDNKSQEMAAKEKAPEHAGMSR